MLGKFSAAGHTYGSFLSLLDQSILNLLFKKNTYLFVMGTLIRRRMRAMSLSTMMDKTWVIKLGWSTFAHRVILPVPQFS